MQNGDLKEGEKQGGEEMVLHSRGLQQLLQFLHPNKPTLRGKMTVVPSISSTL